MDWWLVVLYVKKYQILSKRRQNPVTNVTNIVKRLRKKISMNWIKKTLRFGEKIKTNYQDTCN